MRSKLQLLKSTNTNFKHIKQKLCEFHLVLIKTKCVVVVNFQQEFATSQSSDMHNIKNALNGAVMKVHQL